MCILVTVRRTNPVARIPSSEFDYKLKVCAPTSCPTVKRQPFPYPTKNENSGEFCGHKNCGDRRHRRNPQPAATHWETVHF